MDRNRFNLLRRGYLTTLAVLAVGLCSANAMAKPPATAKSNPKVTMVIEKRGSITIELFQKDAPKTVEHFLNLVNKKFYDGILFHRFENNFVVQAGDPKSKTVDGSKIADISSAAASEKYQLGAGGSGSTVPLEAKQPHERGTLGLARSQAPDSGDSQFFFNLQDNHQLDEGYCVFGKITKGLDVMDKIKQGDKITSVRLLVLTKPIKK